MDPLAIGGRFAPTHTLSSQRCITSEACNLPNKGVAVGVLAMFAYNRYGICDMDLVETTSGNPAASQTVTRRRRHDSGIPGGAASNQFRYILFFLLKYIGEAADSIILRGIPGADVMIERYNSPKMNSPQAENASPNAELTVKGGVGLIGVVSRSTDGSNAGTVNDGQDEVVITDTVASVSRIIDNVTLPNDHENNDMDPIQSQHYQDDPAHGPGPIVDAAATSQGHSKPDADARAPRNERRTQWMAQKKAKKEQRKQENNAKKERNKREGEVEDGLDQNGKKRQHHRHFNPDFNDSRRSSRGPVSIPLQPPILNMYFKGGMTAYSSEVGHIPQISSASVLPLQNVAHHYRKTIYHSHPQAPMQGRGYSPFEPGLLPQPILPDFPYRPPMPMAMRGQVLGSEQRENANVVYPFAASIWSTPTSEPNARDSSGRADKWAQSGRPNRIDSPEIVGVGTCGTSDANKVRKEAEKTLRSILVGPKDQKSDSSTEGKPVPRLTALAEPFNPETLSLHRRSSDGSDSVSPKAKARGVERASTQPAMPLLEKGDDPAEECPIVGISRRMTYPESNRN